MVIVLSKKEQEKEERKNERDQPDRSSVVVFIKVSFVFCFRRVRIMGQLFHRLGEAPKNAPTPKCFFIVSLVDTRDAKTRLGRGLQLACWKVVQY